MGGAQDEHAQGGPGKALPASGCTDASCRGNALAAPRPGERVFLRRASARYSAARLMRRKSRCVVKALCLLLLLNGCAALPTGAGGATARTARALLAAGALLFAPGYLVQRMLRRRGAGPWDVWATAAISLALGLSIVPLLLLWTTVLGLRWHALAAQACTAAAIVAAFWVARPWQRTWRHHLACQLRRPESVALAGILIVAAFTRYTQVRDVALPVWVDSVHQTLITRLIADSGAVPASYEPFLPVATFTRHWGFNALAAWLAWLSGVALPQAVLILGQMLSALAALTAYALVARLTRRRWAGVIGALVTGVISLMPAYYVSWGRYTQLTGMVLLPGAMALLMDALGGTARRTNWPRQAALAALAAAGLVLNHYRVLVFYACFALAYLLSETARRRRDWRAAARLWGQTSLIAVGAAALTGPWLFRLWRDFVLPLETLGARLASDSNYQAIPWSLVNAGHGPLLLRLASAALAWALVRTIWRRTRSRGARAPAERAPWLAALWVLLVGVAVNPRLLGLRDVWVLNNASAAISLFLPLSIAVGYLGSETIRLIIAGVAALRNTVAIRRPSFGTLSARAVRWLAALLILGLAMYSGRGMISIINPSTILATADDVAAMAWIRAHTPADALFLINTRHWQREIYMGTDGGWWIPLLADRRVTLPAIVYRAGSETYKAAINELAAWSSTTLSLEDAEAVTRLRAAGVTHLYIGARGGHFTPEMLAASPSFQPVYASGTVRIYEWRGTPAPAP